MSNRASTSKQNVFEDDEIFEDSSIMANFNNSSFREAAARLSDSNMNDTNSGNGLNVSALCCDEELRGYDKLTGQTWIYPTNYPVRDYQFNIIRAAILKNTLVSLPTGLGKTFIAAVIMYNFYRWYPLGKIVFTAPTRPLVAQQIEACYNIIAIPPNDTIEMTGHMQVTTRKTHWQNKRVFFATPQVIYNDIKSGICPADKIRCLVIDEAHRARGNYAYCQIVSTLTDMGHKLYRILALSATPGSKVDDVVNVVKNLHIAHLELRTESCIDVAPYSHARKINTVIVQLGPELTQLRNQYVEILDGYARRLKQLNILPHNLGNLSKGRIVMLYKEFQNKERGARHPQHNYIMKDFTFLIALYHGLELLVKHGSRVFLNFFDEHPEKSWIQSDEKLTALLERLRDDLGINPLSLNRSILPDGTIPEIPNNISFGHPKFYKLKEIMLEHFNKAKQKGQDTRAIVFCEYRESVNLVHCLLLQCRPLISPQMFVGQGASGKDGKTVVSQKQQLRVMRNFREGACNVLVATCVAEEGLDVGSVDLILCFDISTRSPIRLVQRCGRTGRERGGQVFILVTEGREHQTLQDCMRQRDGLNNKILQSSEVQAGLFAGNPRMLPRDVTPQCQKMYITVKKTDPKDKGRDGDKGKKNQKDLRTMLLGRASSSSSNSSNHFDAANLISEDEFREIFPEGFRITTTFEEPKEYWSMKKETFKAISKEEDKSTLKFHTWLEWQRTLQKTVNVEHSKDTEILASLLQYSDAKRFELPASTQNPTFNTQDVASQNMISASPAKVLTPTKTKQLKKRQKFPIIKSPGKKDGDIRSLFSTATKSTKSYTKLINDLGIQNDGSIPTKLINLFVDLNLDNTNASKTCYICSSICECSLLKNIKTHKRKPLLVTTFLSELKLPEIDLIDEIDTEIILKYTKTLEESQLVGNPNDDVHNVTLEDACNKNHSTNFDLEFDFDLTSPDNIESKDVPNEKEDKNFDIGDIEDIFADSSPEEAIAKDVETKDNNASDPKKALGFFGLDSIEDIFADSDDSAGNKSPKTPPKHDKSDQEIIIESSDKNKPKPLYENRSPSILSGRVITNINTSPILGSQVRKFKLSTKKTQPHSSTPSRNVRRTLIPEPGNNNITPITKSSTMPNNLTDTTNKSMFTITQLVDMINKTGHEKSILSNSNTSKYINQELVDDNRCTSPILLTQADRKKFMNKSISNRNSIPTSQVQKSESLIILDSDSDSDNETQTYEIAKQNCAIPSESRKFSDSFRNPDNSRNLEIELVNTPQIKTGNQLTSKRKLESDDDVTTASPYFNKKQKLDDEGTKPQTLQEKVLAALSSKTTINRFNNDTNVNYALSPTKFPTQKENKSPQFTPKDAKNDDSYDEKEYLRKSNLEMFRRDSKIKSPKNKFNDLLNSQKATPKTQKRKLTFDDSDDDFVESKNGYRNQSTINSNCKTITNHKVRKKKKGNGFLDLEAELSDDGCDSGDELSDDSTGSIADFICDENVTHHDDDMMALYMKSVKSPVKGVFKIPQLPKKYDKEEIFSQFVEEDTYEMDSFCVDSHVGLTQVNDLSELEVAEMILKERKSKKKCKSQQDSPQKDESPVIRRKNKIVRRRIHSDSDDSS